MNVIKKTMQTLIESTSRVQSVRFSPDGRWIVSGSWDGTVRIWDVSTGRQMGESMRGHTNWVKSVAFSPDGRWIVSGSADKTVRIWENKPLMIELEKRRGLCRLMLNEYLIGDLSKLVIGFM